MPCHEFSNTQTLDPEVLAIEKHGKASATAMAGQIRVGTRCSGEEAVMERIEVARKSEVAATINTRFKVMIGGSNGLPDTRAKGERIVETTTSTHIERFALEKSQCHHGDQGTQNGYQANADEKSLKRKLQL